MSGCFDLSGFQGVPSSVAVQYRTFWDTFDRIQAINSNVSTMRAGGRTMTYYIFKNQEERIAFTYGQMLHIQRFPGSNWFPVEKN